MSQHSMMEAGSVGALPGFGFASMNCPATPSYRTGRDAAIELAALSLASRFGIPRCRARTIVELAGLGGRGK